VGQRAAGNSHRDRILREEVAWGCRILHYFGHGDVTLGHVSARRPGTDSMWMKGKGIGLDEVTAAQVVLIDFDGRRLAGTMPLHLELTLHSEVYKVRPDVGAVVHTHAPHTTALGASGQPLQIVSHDGILFVDGVALFNETPELITERGQGAAIAAALGPRKAVILKNHGVLVVGPTVPWAVFTSVTLERAAMMQLLTRGLGIPQPITDRVAHGMYNSKYNDVLLSEYWAYFKRTLRARGLARGVWTTRDGR
jgi:L-fuculose-phosphate aldolase